MKKIEEVNTWVFIDNIKENEESIREVVQAMYNVKSANVNTFVRPDDKKKANVRATIMNIRAVRCNEIVMTRIMKRQCMTSNLSVPRYDVSQEGCRIWGILCTSKTQAARRVVQASCFERLGGRKTGGHVNEIVQGTEETNNSLLYIALVIMICCFYRTTKSRNRARVNLDHFHHDIGASEY